MSNKSTRRKVEGINKNEDDCVNDANTVKDEERAERLRIGNIYSYNTRVIREHAERDKQLASEESIQDVKRQADILNASREAREEEKMKLTNRLAAAKEKRLAGIRSHASKRENRQKAEHAELEQTYKGRYADVMRAQDEAHAIDEHYQSKRKDITTQWEAESLAALKKFSKKEIALKAANTQLKLDGEERKLELERTRRIESTRAVDQRVGLWQTSAIAHDGFLTAATKDEDHLNFQEACRGIVRNFTALKETFAREEVQIAEAISSMKKGKKVRAPPQMNLILEACDNFDGAIQELSTEDQLYEQAQFDLIEETSKFRDSLGAIKIGITVDKDELKDLTGDFKKAKFHLLQIGRFVFLFNKTNSNEFKNALSNEMSKLKTGVAFQKQIEPGSSTSHAPQPVREDIHFEEIEDE